MKKNYDTIEKSEILSKVVRLIVVTPKSVKVKYDCPGIDFVSIAHAVELSKKYNVKIEEC